MWCGAGYGIRSLAKPVPELIKEPPLLLRRLPARRTDQHPVTVAAVVGRSPNRGALPPVMFPCLPAVAPGRLTGGTQHPPPADLRSAGGHHRTDLAGAACSEQFGYVAVGQHLAGRNEIRY